MDHATTTVYNKKKDVTASSSSSSSGLGRLLGRCIPFLGSTQNKTEGKNSWNDNDSGDDGFVSPAVLSPRRIPSLLFARDANKEGDADNNDSDGLGPIAPVASDDFLEVHSPLKVKPARNNSNNNNNNPDSTTSPTDPPATQLPKALDGAALDARRPDTNEDSFMPEDSGVDDFLDCIISGKTDELRQHMAQQTLAALVTSKSSEGFTPNAGASSSQKPASSSTGTNNNTTQQAQTPTGADGYSSGNNNSTSNTTTKPARRYVSSAARSLQNYELVAYLGSGTFAEVTLARHKPTNELFAIKKISKQRVKEEGCVERTFTERQLLSSLRHPFLVRLYQASQSRTHLYLVLDFAQGGDLFYFHQERLWVRDMKRTLRKMRYPYYISANATVSGSSGRQVRFGHSGANESFSRSVLTASNNGSFSAHPIMRLANSFAGGAGNGGGVLNESQEADFFRCFSSSHNQKLSLSPPMSRSGGDTTGRKSKGRKSRDSLAMTPQSQHSSDRYGGGVSGGGGGTADDSNSASVSPREKDSGYMDGIPVISSPSSAGGSSRQRRTDFQELLSARRADSDEPPLRDGDCASAMEGTSARGGGGGGGDDTGLLIAKQREQTDTFTEQDTPQQPPLHTSQQQPPPSPSRPTLPNKPGGGAIYYTTDAVDEFGEGDVSSPMETTTRSGRPTMRPGEALLSEANLRRRQEEADKRGGEAIELDRSSNANSPSPKAPQMSRRRSVQEAVRNTSLRLTECDDEDAESIPLRRSSVCTATGPRLSQPRRSAASRSTDACPSHDESPPDALSGTLSKTNLMPLEYSSDDDGVGGGVNRAGGSRRGGASSTTRSDMLSPSPTPTPQQKLSSPPPASAPLLPASVASFRRPRKSSQRTVSQRQINKKVDENTGDSNSPATPSPRASNTSPKSAYSASATTKSGKVDVSSADYVMHWMEDSKVPLPDFAPDDSRLPLRLVAFYGVEIALVLQYLHKEGFIYRDLKPENILMKRDGDIMLTDFGVAKFRKGAAIGSASKESNQQQSTPAAAADAKNPTSPLQQQQQEQHQSVERTTSFTGTAQYMSPEMLQGLPHDSRTDWWSFGCLLFEWANGRKPFDSDGSQFHLFRSIVESDVRVAPESDFKLTALELHVRTAQLHFRHQEILYNQELQLSVQQSEQSPGSNCTSTSPTDGASGQQQLVFTDTTNFSFQSLRDAQSAASAPGSMRPIVADNLTPVSRDAFMEFAVKQMKEANELLKDLILSLLSRDMNKRLHGAAVLEHPFFKCPYVVSQLYYHPIMTQLREEGGPGNELITMLRTDSTGNIVLQRPTTADASVGVVPLCSQEPQPQQQPGPSDSPVRAEQQQQHLSSPSAATPTTAPLPLDELTAENFVTKMPLLTRPADWEEAFYTSRVVALYAPRLRTTDDLRYFPSAVTAMGLSAAVEQQEKIKAAKERSREQLRHVMRQAEAYLQMSVDDNADNVLQSSQRGGGGNSLRRTSSKRSLANKSFDEASRRFLRLVHGAAEENSGADLTSTVGDLLVSASRRARRNRSADDAQARRVRYPAASDSEEEREGKAATEQSPDVPSPAPILLEGSLTASTTGTLRNTSKRATGRQATISIDEPAVASPASTTPSPPPPQLNIGILTSRSEPKEDMTVSVASSRAETPSGGRVTFAFPEDEKANVASSPQSGKKQKSTPTLEDADDVLARTSKLSKEFLEAALAVAAAGSPSSGGSDAGLNDSTGADGKPIHRAGTSYYECDAGEDEEVEEEEEEDGGENDLGDEDDESLLLSNMKKLQTSPLDDTSNNPNNTRSELDGSTTANPLITTTKLPDIASVLETEQHNPLGHDDSPPPPEFLSTTMPTSPMAHENDQMDDGMPLNRTLVMHSSDGKHTDMSIPGSALTQDEDRPFLETAGADSGYSDDDEHDANDMGRLIQSGSDDEESDEEYSESSFGSMSTATSSSDSNTDAVDILQAVVSRPLGITPPQVKRLQSARRDDPLVAAHHSSSALDSSSPEISVFGAARRKLRPPSLTLDDTTESGTLTDPNSVDLFNNLTTTLLGVAYDVGDEWSNSRVPSQAGSPKWARGAGGGSGSGGADGAATASGGANSNNPSGGSGQRGRGGGPGPYVRRAISGIVNIPRPPLLFPAGSPNNTSSSISTGQPLQGTPSPTSQLPPQQRSAFTTTDTRRPPAEAVSFGTQQRSYPNTGSNSGSPNYIPAPEMTSGSWNNSGSNVIPSPSDFLGFTFEDRNVLAAASNNTVNYFGEQSSLPSPQYNNNNNYNNSSSGYLDNNNDHFQNFSFAAPASSSYGQYRPGRM